MFVKWSFDNILVSSFIWSAFSSKYSVLNFLIFVWGIGFRIRGGLIVVGGGLRAIRVFGGMCNVTGEWSEFRLWSLFMDDVYREWLGVFM